MKKQYRLWLRGIGIGGGILVLAVVAWLITVIPEAVHAGRIVALKTTWITLSDYVREHGALPKEAGEFRRCSFVDAAVREDHTLTGFYYLGYEPLPFPDKDIPIVVIAGRPHWFYQSLCRRRQKTWVQFADGHSETIELPADAVGLMPIWEALAASRTWDSATAEVLRRKFQAVNP